MKAIQTKFLGPTNTRGARIKAFDAVGNRHVISWNSSKDIDENHREAAKALCEKLQIPVGELFQGDLKDSYVFLVKRGEK